jgi:hypothetical protein
MPMFGFGMDKIVGVHQLLSNAIVMDKGTNEEEQEANQDNPDNTGEETENE